MKIQNNRDSASRVITNFDRQLGKYEHSSPSTKEHHAHVILLSIKTLKNINSTDNLKCKYSLQVERAL